MRRYEGPEGSFPAKRLQQSKVEIIICDEQLDENENLMKRDERRAGKWEVVVAVRVTAEDAAVEAAGPVWYYINYEANI